MCTTVTSPLTYFSWRGILGIDVISNRKDLQRALHLVPSSNPYQALLVKSQIYAMKRNPDKAVDVLEEALQFASNEGEKGEVYYFRYIGLVEETWAFFSWGCAAFGGRWEAENI